MDKYLGESIPKLGFGCMRLPMLKNGEVDIEQFTQMADMFINAGFKYFDTAYGYIDGKSEKAIKTVLTDRYPRESFILATKLPAWAGAKTKQEAEQMFYTSLERTAAGYFDFYLLHNLGESRSKAFDDFGIWDFVQKLKKEGLVKHVGFSMHDKADKLEQILKAHPEMEFVQLQINYTDWDNPSIESRKCYEVARKYNKPIIIMEPVKGGNLANPPQNILDIFKKADPKASPSSWAIRFAASLQGVVTVLSGMSNIEQMQDNLSYMKDFRPLSDEEMKVIEAARAEYAKIPVVPCTACAYCMKGCPEKIGIYGTFQAVNMYKMYGDINSSRGSYQWNTQGLGLNKASACIKCGKCEKVCPQHIHIRDELQKAAELFE